MVDSQTDWFVAWSAAVLRDDRLWNAATAYAAERLEQPAKLFRDRIRTCTSHELRRQIRHSGLDIEEGSLVDRLICDVDVSAKADVPMEVPSKLESLRELVDLLSPDELPAIAFRIRATENREAAREYLSKTIHEAVGIATIAPSLPLSVGIPKSLWLEAWPSLQNGFEKSAASENVIEVVGMSVAEVAQRLAETGSLETGSLETSSLETGSLDEKSCDQEGAVRLGRQLTELVAHPSRSLVDSLKEAFQAKPTAAGDGQTGDVDGFTTKNVGSDSGGSDSSLEEDSPFRSAAEAFLFQLLESHEKTVGLFEPNGDPGFRFGNRAAEVDLLCPTLKIAIEVDGYFHFADHEAYRRDRRKDYLMQRHGLLVLRFLAQDVTERMKEVLEDVIAAVRFRHSCLQTPVGPNGPTKPDSEKTLEGER